MQLALIAVAPYVLLGFAAVTNRRTRTPARARSSARTQSAASVISIGRAAPVLAACRVEGNLDVDIASEADLEGAIADPRTPSGVAVLRIDIDVAGDIRNARLLTTSGFPVLDTTALALVRTARIEAAKPGSYRATIVFTE